MAMNVRYRPALAWFSMIDGALLVASWFLQGQVDDVIPLAAGVLVSVMGVQMLRRTYFEFDPELRTIVCRAPIGSYARRFGGGAGGELNVVAGRFVCTQPDGSHRKIRIWRFVARSDEWDAVLAHLASSGR
jgi:hypothetical protein